MAEPPQTLRQFYRLVRRAAIDALSVIRHWEEDGKFFLRRASFPTVSYYESGLPYFREGQGLLGDTPINYLYPFEALSGDRVPLPDSWEELWDFVCAEDRLREFFDVDRFEPAPTSTLGSIAKFNLQSQLRQLVDHYVHTSGLKRFRKRKFIPHFVNWASACYPKKAPVQFVVPVIRLDFEVDDRSELANSVWLERMTEEFQLARAPRDDQSVSINEGVLGAATHALVLDNWDLPNESLWDRDMIPTDLNALDPILPLIERFFAAVRIATGFDTGYGQVVTRPVGWCDRWQAHVPGLFVLQLRQYPERIERNWRRAEREVVTADHMASIASIYAGLSRGGANRLAIASRRLSAAYLRREEQDSVLDICIGLEALFVGEQKGETTHKLATRIAAVWSLEETGDLTPFEAFSSVKRLYDYRSAVVHGSRKAERKRVIKPRPGVEIEAVDLGLEVLRHCLAVTVRRPDLLEEGALDRILIEGDWAAPGGAS